MLNGIVHRGWQLGVGAIIAVLLGGCASFPLGYSDFPAKQTWLLSERSASAEDNSLAAQFYRNSGFEGQWQKDGRVRMPIHASAIRHEVAGYQAMLGGDDEARSFHFLSAASDLNSPLTEFYLWEATRSSLGAAQLNAVLALAQKIAHEHPRQDARSYAARLAAGILKRRGKMSEQVALMKSLGWITQFKILGSFDNDQGKGFLTEYGPETNADLGARFQGSLTEIGWREVPANAMSQIPLGDLLSPGNWSAAYLQTYIQSSVEKTAVLSLSTSDPAIVWVNGQLVGSDENVENGSTDNFRVPVQLKKGWNRLLIKSANRYGGWRLGARFLDVNGSPLSDLVAQSSTPEDVAVVTSPPFDEKVSGYHPLVKSVRAIKDPIRRQIILARALKMLGYSLEAHRSILDLPPKSYGSVIVNYWAAMSFWDNGEQGKAIDLINATLQANGEELPGFLLKRARFYKQKSLWERAMVDIEHVLELVPKSRAALISLANLLEQRGWQVDRCRILDQVLTFWPDWRSATLEKGACMKARGYYFDARTYYDLAHALEPKNTYGIRQLILLELDAINLDSAEELAFQLTQLEPWRPRRFLELGDIQRKAGRSDEAILSYKQAIELDPDWSQPHYRLGTMAYEENATQEAIAHWRTSLKLNPTNSSLADHLDFVDPQGESVAEQYVPSDEQIAKLVKSASSLSPLPGSQVVDLLDHEITRVNSDGSSKRIVTRVAVAVSKRGRDELIVASVPRRGRVKLLQAYAVSASGERQQSSSIRNGVIRYRNLEIGSVVVLQFVHYASSPAFLPNHYVGSWHFQGVHRENKNSNWVLILPKNRKLNIYQTENVTLKKEELEEDTVYHFISKDVPPLIAEPFTRPYIDLVRRVTVSTVEDWDEYVQWERALLKDAFSEEGNIEELARTVTKGAKTPLEKIRKIFHYAAQEIRYQQDYENTIAGVKPHAAPVVIERGYGDCKDKAVLMIGLAKKLDLELRFAILRTTNAGRVIKETPNQQFNHAIVYVPKQDGIQEGFFLDPTTDGLDMGNLRHDDQGAESLVFNPRDDSYEFISIPYQSPTFQAHHYSININVKSVTEAEANLRYSGRGTVAASARRILRNTEQAKKFYEKVGARMFVASSVVDATVKNNDDIWEPLELNLNLNISNSVQTSGKAYRLKLPQTFPLNRVVSLNSRTTPLYMGVPDTLDTTVKVSLPRGFGFKDTPQNLELRHKCFSFIRQIKQKYRSLEIKTNYTRSCVEVTTEEYQSFRDAVQKAATNTQDFILFESGRRS